MTKKDGEARHARGSTTMRVPRSDRVLYLTDLGVCGIFWDRLLKMVNRS